ncbi:MAG: GAF domain-containing protein, partial [Anaerolineae bacterium]
RFPVDQFPAISLVLAEEPIFVDNIPESPQIDSVTKMVFAQQKALAMAVLPLWLGSVQTGILMLVSEKPYHFTADEIRPYRSLAGQVAIAVENRRLFEQTQRQLADLDTIQMTMSHLTAALTSEEAIDALLPQVAGIALAETVVMYAVDGDYMIRSGIYSTVERQDLIVGEIELLDDYPLTRQVLETRQPLVLLADDPRLQSHARDAYDGA